MIGVLFATKTEASPFLDSIRASITQEEPFLLFKSSECSKVSPCVVIISGIGKVSAAAATVELILKHKVKTIINVGICGALNDNLPSTLGGVYRISSAVEGDRSLDLKSYVKVFECFPFFTDLKEAILVTCDKSVFDDGLRCNLSRIADLVDMEGAAVVRIANMYNVKCDIIKGVSDLANTGGIKVMKSNVKRVSLALAEVLLHAIGK